MARPTGSKNKNTQFLLNRLQEMYGADFNPILKMAENATRLQKQVDKQLDESLIYETEKGGKDSTIRLANDEWAKIAPYVSPKLKSVEMELGEGVDIPVFTMVVHQGDDVKDAQEIHSPSDTE